MKKQALHIARDGHKGSYLSFGIIVFLIILVFAWMGIELTRDYLQTQAPVFTAISSIALPAIIIPGLAMLLLHLRGQLFINQSRVPSPDILNSLQDGIICTDANGHITFMNDKAQELTGWNLKEIRGRHIRDYYHVMHETSGQKIDPVWHRTLETHRDVPPENNTVLHTRMGPRTIHNSCMALQSGQNECQGAMLVFNESEEVKNNSNEEKYRKLIEQATDGIILYSLNGSIYEFNRAVHELLGYGREEFAKLLLPDLLADGPIIKDQVKVSKMMEGESVIFNRTIKRKDGRELEVEINGRVFEPGKILAFVRDITERKKAEEQIRQLSLIARKTINAVIVTDKAEKITWVNEAFTTITGYSFEEALGRSPGELLHGPHTDQSTVSYMRHCMKQLQNFECDIVSYSKSGKPCWLHVQGQPQFDDCGQHTGFFAIETDVTLLKQAQESLAASEAQYRNLFQKSPTNIIIWDIDNLRILEVNKTAGQTYGYSQEEFTQLSLLDIRKPENRQAFLDHLPVIRSNENGILSRNWKHVNRQGEEMILHIVSHRIQYKGRPAMMSISINITEQVRLKEKLSAERKARQKEITSAVITAQESERRNIGIELHDNINQVLASARLYLDLAREKKDQQDVLIKETGSLINRAIDEIRALSHSLVPPSLEDISLSGALREMTHILSVATGLRIVRNIEEIEEDAISYQLRLAIYRVVQEQLNNIIRHARAQTVWIHLFRKESSLCLIVKDDGRGFDPAKRSGGVGIMNMKTRVSLFGGNFHISSSPGNGCELSVSFNTEV